MNHKNCMVVSKSAGKQPSCNFLFSFFRGVAFVQRVCSLWPTTESVSAGLCKNTERGALLSLSVFSAVCVMKSRRGPSVRGVWAEPEAIAAIMEHALQVYSHKTQQCSTSLHSCDLEWKVLRNNHVITNNISFHSYLSHSFVLVNTLLFIFHLFQLAWAPLLPFALWSQRGGAKYKCCVQFIEIT